MCRSVGLPQAGVAGVDVGVAFFAAEDGAFGEDCQTIQCGRSGDADYGICQHPVVEGDIDAVVGAVECYRLHINVGVEQFGAADPGVGAGIQQFLGPGG